MVIVTDDRRGAAEKLVEELGGSGLELEHALATPFLAIGTHDEIADHFVECRRRWGITNYSVRTIEELQPVIERLRRVDAAA